MIKSMLRDSNVLLKSAEYAITRKEHFYFLALTSCKDTATERYPDFPSPAKNQCALQLRVPGQDHLFLSLSYFSLVDKPPSFQLAGSLTIYAKTTVTWFSRFLNGINYLYCRNCSKMFRSLYL
jgi:hypothetical protein